MLLFFTVGRFSATWSAPKSFYNRKKSQFFSGVCRLFCCGKIFGSWSAPQIFHARVDALKGQIKLSDRHFKLITSLSDKMPKFGNVRQVMLKQRRGAKCPFLTRFVNLSLKKGARDSFVATSEAFGQYCAAVALWTEEDSLHGQTQYLIKKKAFDKAST